MRFLACSLLVCLTMLQVLPAQQAPAPIEVPDLNEIQRNAASALAATPLVENSQPGAPSTTTTAPQTGPVRERERTIYVPYEDIEKMFADGGKGVFLPYKEFLELWNELTLKRKGEEVKPPQEGVVTRAEYTGRVEGSTLVIDAKITVQSFKSGWLTVPLARDGAGIGISEADTGNAILQSKQDGYDVLLPDKGVYDLKLKIYAPVIKAAGKSQVKLALPRAAVSRFTAIVPDTGLEFEVTPAAAFTSRPAGAATELSFFFGSGGKFDVTWGKPEAATDLTPLILASTSLTTEVRSGSLVTNAKVNLRILRAPVATFSLLLPASQTVQGVTGTDIKDWKLEPAGEQQKLTINANAPVKDTWSVNVILDSPLPKLPADVSVPEIIVAGASQDRGEVDISAETQLDVTPKPSEALVQQTQNVQPAGGLTAVGGYRFLKHPAVLSLAVAEAKPQVDVENYTQLVIRRDSTLVDAIFFFNVRRVGIFEARITLPAGWTGWDVVGTSAENWTIDKTAGGEVLVLKLPKQTTGTVGLTLRAQQARLAAIEDVKVPVFAPQNVLRYESKIGVVVEQSLEASTKTLGDLKVDDVSSLSRYTDRADAESKKLSVYPSGSELILAFRHRDAAANAATLSFKARAPQVNVEVLTLLEAREQSLRHAWTLAFDIAYAATDRFILAVPKVVADDIRFVDPSVKEIHKDYKADAKMTDALPGAADYVLWEVVLRSERMGAFKLALSVEKPIAGGKEAKLDMLQLHVPGVFQETGQVAVVKDDSLEIRDYKAESLDEIDPKELHGPLQRGGVFLAFKYRSQPLKLSFDVARNVYIPVPQAIVTHSVLTTAVATDQAQTTEAIYWVKNNAQQFLTVKLPAGARLVSDVFVNDSTQQPMHREGADDLLIRLPTGSVSSASSFPVRFVYEMPSPQAGEKLGAVGSFGIEPPTLVNVGVVMEAHHQLWLPEGYFYTKFDGPMTLSARDRGWQAFRNIADFLVPAFGPQMTRPNGDWKTVPGIPAQHKAALGFQVPEQGQNVKLHRLGAPASVTVHFRSRTTAFVLEAIVFLLVCISGWLVTRKPLSNRVAWALGISLVAIISTGVLSAANGRMAKSAVLAVGLVVFIWLLAGVFSFFRRAGRRVRAAVSPPSTPVPPPSFASPPPTAEATAPPPVAQTPLTDDTLEFPKLREDDEPEAK